jgi:hypothetical protein
MSHLQNSWRLPMEWQKRCAGGMAQTEERPNGWRDCSEYGDWPIGPSSVPSSFC